MTHAKTHGCSEATKSAAKKAAKKALGNKKRPRPEPLAVNCKQVLHRPDELARLIGQVPFAINFSAGISENQFDFDRKLPSVLLFMYLARDQF